jgi:superfamily II DNA or RNA helicase
MNRTERQTLGLQKWSAFDFKGIAQYPTGFGKTYTAIRAIKGMITKKGITSALVIVPTIELKNQWEKELTIHKVKIAEVLVINTAIKRQHNVDFLVLDEIHRFAAETFKEIFVQASYKYIIGLTATLEREDGLHEIILDNLSIFDTISVDEAMKNKWIAPYQIYNIAVPFPEEEAIAYKKSNNSFRHFAAKLGYGGSAFKVAKQWINSKDPKEQGIAAAYYNSMRTRKKICLGNSNKIHAIKDIVNVFPERNGLLFSASTDSADDAQKVLGDIAMTFHSKLTKKNQIDVIKRFKDKRTKVRILSTVKALNEGFDVPGCSLGIIAGSNSTKITFIQQLGRIVRYQEDKIAILVNLYTPDTQEVTWMNKRMESINKEVIKNVTLDEFKLIFA